MGVKYCSAKQSFDILARALDKGQYLGIIRDDFC